MVLSPVVNQLVEYGTLRVTMARYWRILRTPRLYIFIPAWVSIMALVGIWLSSQLTFVLSMPSHSHPHQLLMGIFSGAYAGRYISLVLGVLALVFGLCLLFWAFFLGRLSRLRLMLNSIAGIYLACIALAGINHLGFHNLWLLLIRPGLPGGYLRRFRQRSWSGHGPVLNFPWHRPDSRQWPGRPLCPPVRL
jgi:hypothetical protein